MTRPILNAAEMRAAEARAIAAGTPVEALMERAGAGVAEVAWRFAGPAPVLVVCGPGNNGGDGYVAARLLRARDVNVRVAALGVPKDGAAAAARAAWDGPIESIEEARPAPLVIDALFGTGLTRALDAPTAERLSALVEQARCSIAVDLPSGVDTDSGVCVDEVPAFDLTVTFATLKPAHRLQPSASRCGRIAIVDIGTEAQSALVAVIGGAMPGAAELAALAAAHAGAGYVALFQSELRFASPHAIVRRPIADLPTGLSDDRTGAVVVGPGLGRNADAKAALVAGLASGRPIVVDGDALHLLDPLRLRMLRSCPAILTPHEGEFRALFPDITHGSKIERARAAARRTGAVIVYKGADTVIAAPDGRAAIAGDASPWLSTAGTGDVLAGAIAAMLARGLGPFESAKAGTWLHAEAARRAGRAFVADDLARHLASVL